MPAHEFNLFCEQFCGILQIWQLRRPGGYHFPFDFFLGVDSRGIYNATGGTFLSIYRE